MQGMKTFRDFLKLPLLSWVWQMRFDVDDRLSLVTKILEIILLRLTAETEISISIGCA
jgi:hypothetical protein